MRNTTGGTEERKGEGETRLKRYNKSTSCVLHFLFAKQVINNRNKHTYEKPFRGYATKFSLNGEYNRTIISLYLQTYRRRYYERNNNFEYREACQETVFLRERNIKRFSTRYSRCVGRTFADSLLFLLLNNGSSHEALAKDSGRPFYVSQVSQDTTIHSPPPPFFLHHFPPFEAMYSPISSITSMIRVRYMSVARHSLSIRSGRRSPYT